MRRITLAALAVLSMQGLWSAEWSAWAQQIPKALQQGGPESEIKTRRNAWTVGIAGGILEGTFFRFAEEMRKVVDDGDEMRVLPVVTRGAASNLEDLLYLRGIDIAVTQSDVFEYFRTQRKISNLDERIHFILRFPVAEVTVIARSSIRSLEDLRGKKVDFGFPGSSGSLTSPIIFQRLGINVQETKLSNPYSVSAYQRVAAGEVDAAVRVVSKPVDHVADVPPNSGVHLLPIPFTRTFADFYTLGEFTNADYPNFVPPGQRVDTLAVPVVLAVYNWPKNSERYRKVERFVTRLFENWDKLRKPPFHAKWRDINLAATVPGWKRFAAAEEQLEKMLGSSAVSQQELSQEFRAFLSGREGRAVRPGQTEREELFREFLQWRQRRGAQAR